jgi:hypothetical protein
MQIVLIYSKRIKRLWIKLICDDLREILKRFLADDRRFETLIFEDSPCTSFDKPDQSICHPER